MKKAIPWLLFIVVFLKTVEGKLNSELDGHWQLYKNVHRKHYEDDQTEFFRRLIWESNLRYIQQHNLDYDMGKHTYTLGMNQFGDLTHEEFKATHLTEMLKMKSNSDNSESTFMSPLNMKDLPDSVDWRKEGYVSPVKNQGQCGSCWAFASVAATEGQYFRKTHHLEQLSVQQLVDCSGEFGNMGCNGGLPDSAYQYIEKYGLERESDYPYTAMDGTCKYNASKVIAKSHGYVDIPTGREDILKVAVATVGPLSAAIDASHTSFQFYRSGVYNEPACSSTNLDHGMILIGYGKLNNVPYWLLQNMWGTNWGDAGYVYMSRDKNNQCGIATVAAYPLL